MNSKDIFNIIVECNKLQAEAIARHSKKGSFNLSKNDKPSTFNLNKSKK